MSSAISRCPRKSCSVRLMGAPCLLARRPQFWHSALVTKVSVRQSSGLRCLPGIRTLAEHFSAESAFRLLPSVYPLLWQSLSAASLQSGAPFDEAGQATRPDTMVDGFARRDKSFMVSLGLLIGGRIEGSLSNSLPISLISPGFSSRAGGDEGADVEGGGAVCGPCSCKPSAGAADCGELVLPAPSRSKSTANISVPGRRTGLPDRTIMTATVAEPGEAAKRGVIERT